MKKIKRIIIVLLGLIVLSASVPLTAFASAGGESEKPIILRISNWEEYIDLGDWDEEEAIDLDSGTIIGEISMIDEFEDWYYETYGRKVKVEYSTFGSNEDFYNMLTLGDVFDLTCPSEYMVMKLMAEDRVVPFSDEFYDTENELNYYINGVSPYIQSILEENGLNNEPWSKYMACYMWGITGFVYNPEIMTREEASTCMVLVNPKFSRQISVKDSLRDSYFAAVAAVKRDLLTSEEFLNDPNYKKNLQREMNDTSPETIEKVLDFLQEVKKNCYSFESDAGKADLISGKAAANYQWSGDAVYSLDQAEEVDLRLDFAIPEEASNIYFDGWCMLKNGINGDPDKQHAAEAFINYVSRPDNVIRNMYYVGYTSAIAAPEDGRIFEYAQWNFEAEDDEEETVDYPLGYFFTGDNEDENFIINAPADQINRQLVSQYPDAKAMERTSIMEYFDEETYDEIYQMWIKVRCCNIKDIPVYIWILIGATAIGFIALGIYNSRKKYR
ncbi:MAG: extracellular solute-binding protein [Lachnospiraceae bacterium]|jgi:spermidine/putrescine transport system substrate-binding protein